MRPFFAATAAAFVFLATVTAGGQPVLAGVGLPKVGTAPAGHYDVTLNVDSPKPRVGANRFTVSIPGLAPETVVRLQLQGPAGEVVPVALKQVQVLGQADQHGESREAGHNQGPGTAPAKASTDHGHETPAPVKAENDHGHGTPDPVKTESGHGSPSIAAGDSHGDASDDHGGLTEEYLARGTARLNASGRWVALVEFTGADGVAAQAELVVKVVADSPNALYLSATGLLSGGAILFGLLQRRRAVKP